MAAESSPTCLDLWYYFQYKCINLSGQGNMGEANDLESLLHRLEEQQRQAAKGLTGLEDFAVFTGTLPLDPSLELAVLTLTNVQYRGIAQWRVHQTYSFTCQGIYLRTYVESWEPGIPIRFTPEEAIVIARHLNQQNLNQQNCFDADPEI